MMSQFTEIETATDLKIQMASINKVRTKTIWLEKLTDRQSITKRYFNWAMILKEMSSDDSIKVGQWNPKTWIKNDIRQSVKWW